MKRRTTKEFIEDSKKIHGDEYDYSKCVFKNVDTKVTIICKIHGEFQQIAYNHLVGHKCKKCISKFDERELKMVSDNFFKKVNKIHKNKYDYSKSIYKSAKEKIIIICPIHGEFEQTPDSHTKSGCPKCGLEFCKEFSISQRTTIEEFIKKSKEIFGDKYDYNKTIYSGYKKDLIIICKIHGEFVVNPSNHISNKRGCPYCYKASEGELLIAKLLIQNKINFEYEKWFDDLRNPETNRPYRFDFYINDKNILIEFDGIHHFMPVGIWGGDENFEKVKKVDYLKNEYCVENNIKLIRINKYKEIENILKENNIIK